MPIEVEFLDPTAALTCDQQLLVTASPVFHQGCEIFTSTPVYVVAKGQEAVLEHVLRNARGEPIDLTNCLIPPTAEDDPGKVIFRFYDATSQESYGYQVIGDYEDLVSGRVRVQLPPDVVNESCIYHVEIGLINQEGKLVFTNRAYFMVERGLFGNEQTMGLGPLSRDEVRMALRDVMEMNDLTGDVDFDDAEIIHAIIRPVMDWNEQPPNVVYYSACTFPHREHWLRASCVHLLRTAAAWFERNKLLTSAGGVQTNDRDKARDYLNIAAMLQDEWRVWMRQQKAMLNVSQAYGSFELT